MNGPVANLEEVRRLFGELPGPDLDAATEASRRTAELGADSLGRLGELATWLASWQGVHPPHVSHPRTALFAASHGVASRLGVAPDGTAARVARCVGGGAAVNHVCRSVDADLRVYEMALERPTVDFTAGAAMEEEECAHAMAYGMMAVEPGIDLIVLGEMGGGSEAAATALSALLFGGAASEWLDTGADRGLVDTVEAALRLHRGGAGDAFDKLRRVGGRELAAIIGTVMAARLARVPVVLDGFAAVAAASVVFAFDRRSLDHCLAAQVPSTLGHARLLGILGKKPLLGLDTGEGTAGTLAVAVLKAAVTCHTAMVSRG